MGRAIAALIDHELARIIGDSSGGTGPVFEEQAHRLLADRESIERPSSPKPKTGCAGGVTAYEPANARWRPVNGDSKSRRDWRASPREVRRRQAAMSAARAVLASSTSTATARPEVAGPVQRDAR
jgi:hypothetical protein